jgi:hypothetical protein
MDTRGAKAVAGEGEMSQKATGGDSTEPDPS